MSISGAITKIDALSKNDLLDRVIKSVVGAVVVQSTLYTTVVPNPPSMQTSGVVAGGVGVFSLVVNGILTWARKSQAKKLAELGAAIEAAAKLLVEADKAIAPAKIPAV